MNDHVSTLRVDLTGNLSPEAKAMGEALLRAAADAKKLDEALEQSGGSRKMQERLRAIGAGVAQVDAVTAAMKRYAETEKLAADRKDWTRDQANGMRAFEQTIVSAARVQINADRAAATRQEEMRREQAREAKRVADQEIADRRRVAEEAEREIRREQQARQRAHERELAEERRHLERITEQRREAEHRMSFRHYVAGGVVAGVSAHGVVSGIEKAAEKGNELQDLRISMGNAGIGKDELARIERNALALSRTYGNVSQTTVMELAKDARSVLKDVSEVDKITAVLAKAHSALELSGGHSEGLGALVKGSEAIGAANDPERFAKLVDGYVKAIQVMGNTINPEQIYEFDKYAKTAGATMSDRFLMTTGLSLSQEMGGSTAANDIFHAQKDIVGGFQNKHVPLKEMARLGLIDRNDIEYTRTGEAKGIKAGHKGVHNAELAQTDLDEWVYGTLLKAFDKKGIRTEAAQLAEVNKIFTGGEADVISKLITQRESFENHAKLYGGAKGTAAANDANESAAQGVSAVSTALGNLAANITVSAMAPVGKALYMVADALNAAAEAAAAHPDLALAGGIAAGAAALAAAGKIGQMAMNGFGSVARAGAVHEGAARTQVTAAELQLKAAGIEAQAAATEATAAETEVAAARENALAGGAMGGVLKSLMLYQVAALAKENHVLEPPKSGGWRGVLEFLDPGLADRVYGPENSGPTEPSASDAPAAPASSPPPGPGDDSPAYVPMSYGARAGDKVPLARQPGFSRADYTGGDDGIDRGPIEGQAPDERLELAVAAGTEAGVLAAFAKMKNDGSLPGAGVPGLGGGDLAGGGGTFSGGGGTAGAPNLRYGRRAGGGGYRGTPGQDTDAGAYNARQPDKPGMYRPVYNLGDRDVDDDVVNTIAGEARTSNSEGVDAVVNNMMNRLGSKGWGPSGDLHDVARARGQYAGYRRASQREADFIRSRIRAIASGGVPDNTHGANAYRADWYRGPWYQRHAQQGVDIGGNLFAYESSTPNGPYAPYKEPHGTPSAAASASGPAPAGSVGEHLADMKRNGLLSDEQCVTLAMASAGIRKGSGQLGSNVHDWRRGAGADQGTLQPGDAVATFLNRDGSQNARGLYAGGGAGTPGAGLDHAGVFRRYVMGPDGKPSGMVISEQYQGSHGVHDRTYMFGQGSGEHNGSNYSRVMLRDGSALGGGAPRDGRSDGSVPRAHQPDQTQAQLFDHDHLHGTLSLVRQIRREVAQLGTASVSVISGPAKGGPRGRSTPSSVGRALRGAPASSGSAIA